MPKSRVRKSTKVRTRRKSDRPNNSLFAVTVLMLIAVLVTSAVTCTIGKTGLNLAIEMQDERLGMLLTEAYYNCPYPSEQYFNIRDAEARLVEKTRELEDKLESSLSMNPNMDLREAHAIPQVTKDFVDEVQKTLKDLGCLDRGETNR